VIDVECAGEALEAVVKHHAFLVAVSGAEKYPGALRSAAARDLVLLEQRLPGHGIDPVGVDAVGDARPAGAVRVFTCIAQGLALQLEQFAGIEQFELFGEVHQSPLHVEVEGHARIRLAAFGGDQHHSVGRAGAVNSLGGSVLEHFDRLDVVGVEHGEGIVALAAKAPGGQSAVAHGYAVDDEQWAVRARDGGIAPHPHHDAAAGGARRLRDRYARHLPLQGLVEPDDGHVLDRFGTERGDGPDDVPLFLSGITGYDNLLKLLGCLPPARYRSGSAR
jgi:hypothetical protein